MMVYQHIFAALLKLCLAAVWLTSWMLFELPAKYNLSASSANAQWSVVDELANGVLTKLGNCCKKGCLNKKQGACEQYTVCCTCQDQH